MKAKLLMTTAALALALGAAGANAQNRTDDTTKHGATTQDQRPLTEKDKADSKKMPASNAAQKQENATGNKSAADRDQATDKKKADSAAPAETKQPSSAQTTPPKTEPKAAESDKKPASPATQNNAAAPKDTSSPTAASKDSATQPSAAKTDPNANKANQAASPNAAPSTNQQTNNAQAQPATRVSASLQTEQKTRLNQAVTKLDVKPVTNVNFSVSVGTAVPTTVSLHPVPTTIVEIVPQYRGYSFFMVRDEVVIVEPHTHKIVDVIERRGSSSQARSTTTTERKINLSQKQREYIRQHSSRRTTTTTTTGSAPRTKTLVVGEEAPETVEIETFPEEVYREVPAVRSYRYIRSGDDVYLVEPGSRRIIEEIE